jgi:iron complex outermembrane recepter protein
MTDGRHDDRIGARRTATLLLAVGLLAGTAAGPAAAQQGAPARQAAGPQPADTTPVYTMSEVVVLGERSSVNRAATASEVDHFRIRQLDARSARDALEFVPGVYFHRNSRNEFAFRLRGFEQRQVTVFLDGVPVSLAYDGLVDISQFSAADLHRVQVSQGFSSMLYGANSLGGSINLVTAPPARRPAVSARLEQSDHGRSFAAGSVAGGLGALRLSGSASWTEAASFRLSNRFEPAANEAGGERDNSGYEKKQAGLRAHYTFSPAHQAGVSLARVENRYDVPPNALSAHPRFWRFPEWSRSQASLTTRHLLGEHLALRTAWYQDSYYNLLRSFDDATYTTQTRRYAFDSEYDDDSRGVNLYPSLTLLPFGRTEALFAYRKDVHREGDLQSPHTRVDAATLTLALEQDVQLSERLGFVVGAGMSRLSPAARGATGATGAAADGAAPAFAAMRQHNGQVAVQYRWNTALSTHVALSRKSRFPTLKEFYSARQGQYLPNPELRSEAAIHAEVGTGFQTGGWRARAALFRSELEDLIADVALGHNVRQMQNVRTATMQGGELELGRELGSASAALNYSFLAAENTSADAESRRLEYRPAHRLTGLVELRPHPRMSAGLEASYTARQFFRNPDSGSWQRLDDGALLNLRAEYRLRPGLGLYGRVDNVLDRAHDSQYGVPMPGRELSTGLKLTL